MSCRVCGATHAPPDNNKFGICKTCHTAFFYRNGRKRVTESDFLRLLADTLVLHMKRYRRTNVLGRCEALSDCTYGYRGYQCGLSAIAIRDGHKVCGSHARATSPVFVTAATTNNYDVVRDLVAEISAKDALFTEAIKAGLS